MKILITGYGKMGRMVEELAQQKGWEILAALDGQDAKLLRQLKKADAAIDFSHPAMLDSLANYIRRTGTPLISGTTGYSEDPYNPYMPFTQRCMCKMLRSQHGNW